jgi:hypothetical protein
MCGALCFPVHRGSVVSGRRDQEADDATLTEGAVLYPVENHMIMETPLEITHLRTRLRQNFTDKLPEATFGSGEEKERNFLSRALTAFAIQSLSGCSPEDAVAAVVDGGGDSGIDGIQYSPTMHRLWVVQSKFFADGQGEPSLADVSKFKNGLEALLQGQFDVFHANAGLAQKIPQLQAHFDDTSLEVRAVLVYSGTHLVSEDRIHLSKT